MRVLRILPPGWHAQAELRDSPWCTSARQLCDGQVLTLECISGPSGSFSMVYAMFNHAAVYIGKANVHRVGGPGWPARLGEHLRGIVNPETRDGKRPRYHLMRRSMGSVCFIPVLWTVSERRALAFESVGIKFEAPEANVREMRFEGKSQGVPERLRFRGERRRPSSWRGRADRAVSR